MVRGYDSPQITHTPYDVFKALPVARQAEIWFDRLSMITIDDDARWLTEQESLRSIRDACYLERQTIDLWGGESQLRSSTLLMLTSFIALNARYDFQHTRAQIQLHDAMISAAHLITDPDLLDETYHADVEEE